VRVRLHPNILAVGLLSLAVLGSLGPHLLMLGYKVAGARPPLVLSYFCVLQHDGGRPPAATHDISWRLRR
jgi:hypothetical protein